jgi:uncharacterized protein (DUF1015 family)
MATVLPFKAFLPEKSAAQYIVSRAVENYTKDQLQEITSSNPRSFLNIIRPAAHDEPKRMVRKRFLDFLKAGHFHPCKKDSYLIYRQTEGEKSYNGIIALASVKDYESGSIKLHEQTLTERENLLAEYLDQVNLNAEPVCFAHPRSIELENAIRLIQRKKPFLDFQEGDNFRHQVWVAHSEEEIKVIQKAFAQIPAIYIADGHHRSASSVRLAEIRRQELGRENEQDPWEYFMGIFFSEDQLEIFEFNRLIKGFEDFNLDILLNKLERDFIIIPHQENPFEPMFQHEFGMYTKEKWFELNLKNKERLGSNPVDTLDPQIFNTYILEPCFGMHDLKTDKRIRFLTGKAGLETLKQRVDSGKYQAGFTLYPVSVKELFTIADQHLTMPPKSTWVEPKLLSGLSVYDLGEKK